MPDLTILEATSATVSITLRDGDTVPDIRSDTVRLYLYNADTKMLVLDKLADVTTEGINGIAILALTPTDTAIPVGEYIAEIVWSRVSGDIHAAVETWGVRERLSA